MGTRPPHPKIITLLTDFGYRDAYVGSMKGVILSRNPWVQVVDLSHEVPPQDIVFGALVLQSTWRYFPPGTIHLAVVDPGVGSRRRLLAAAVGEHFLVGPDNGLFSLIFAEEPPQTMVSLENPGFFLPQVSATFHGRDILAPAAAHLSLGLPLAAFGPELKEPVPLDLPAPQFSESAVTGQVIAVDHFGNLITNIPSGQLQAWRQGRAARLWVADQPVPYWAATYSEVPPAALLALAGSHGYLEIACREGSAAARLGAGKGTTVRLLTAAGTAGSSSGQEPTAVR
ncbi:MAG: SAM hydrolase/SAM-dependent halogenase family protein [Desulfobacca sp.]|uniref:SAM hydrolase/SAM-dependent halogenase family protein n=1 Tax=Desulfobacca sp. TaxID=2067990 RepID=UPI00404AC826